MSKTRYKINGDQIINVKGVGRLTNENITPEIAKRLLSTGQYNSIIEEIGAKIEESNNTGLEDKPINKKKIKNKNIETPIEDSNTDTNEE
jgi:hypothetical protein